MKQKRCACAASAAGDVSAEQLAEEALIFENRGGRVPPRKGYAGGGGIMPYITGGNGSIMDAIKGITGGSNSTTSGDSGGGFGWEQAIPMALNIASMFMNKGGNVGIARKHYDEGGVVGGLGGISAGASPMQQNQYQQFANMPVEKLQEMAARIPPNNPQGQLIQRALKQKQAMPQTNQQPQSGIAQPQAGTAPGASTSPTQLPTLANPPGYARGGRMHMDDGGIAGTEGDWSNYGLANTLDNNAQRDPDQLYDRLDPTRLSLSMTKDNKAIGPINWKGFAQTDDSRINNVNGRQEYSDNIPSGVPNYGYKGSDQYSSIPNSLPSLGISGPPPAPSRVSATQPTSKPASALSGIAAENAPDASSTKAPKDSNDINMALMAAGFGMMAGKSPHALENVGQGGIEGLKEYSSVKTAEREAQKLANEADYHKQQLAIEGRKADQQAQYQQGELGNSASRIAMEREHYSNTDNNGTWFSGNGPDENGNTVAGSYHAPKQGGQPQFYPGLTMNGINRRGPASDFDINKQAQITTDKELINGTITKSQYAQTLQQHTQELQRQLQQNGQPPAGNQRPAGSSPATAKDYINLYGKPQEPDQNNNGE